MSVDEVTITDAIEVLSYGEHAARHRRRLVRTYASGRVEWNERARELYSYGAHFPLARHVPARGNVPALWVINGDRWRGSRSSRTGNHQAITRARIERTSIASLVIPFSALNGAAIDIDSIRPVHVRPDANWEETRYADALALVPRHERTYQEKVTHYADAFAGLPEHERTRWRAVTDADVAAHKYGAGSAPRLGEWSSLPVLPDADGRYSWTEYVTRERERDSDGRYSWTVQIHRLGDALFTAARTETRTRLARPGDSAILAAGTWTERELCAANPYAAGDGSGAAHVADESGRACVFCHGALAPRTETVRRRGLFLSSFDMNEAPPLYFLAQLPRGSGARTVETALDALAPPAVHAARARGRAVYRQGDIFFIETDASTDELAARGARFGRLTQWTRDARARAGEAGYVKPLTAAQRRRREAREARERARIWRQSFRSAGAQLETSGPRNAEAHEARRAEHAERWHELLTRHAAERGAVSASGAAMDAPESAPCETCGAAVGAPCRSLAEADAEAPTFLISRTDADLASYGAHRNRQAVGPRHKYERGTLKDQTSTERGGNGAAPGRPSTEHGARRRYAAQRLAALAKLDAARADLRRASFGIVPDYLRRASYGETQAVALRRGRAAFARAARDRYAEAEARYARSWHARGAERDAYRAPWMRRTSTDAALITWRLAVTSAAVLIRPDQFDGAAIAKRRERVRHACAIYGTAHGATETARLPGGAFYARGIVRHVPDLENGRVGGRDHAPTMLGADGARWFLALRNTVPRQRAAAAVR